MGLLGNDAAVCVCMLHAWLCSGSTFPFHACAHNLYYGFPLCVLLMCLRCIIMFMHDHPFLFLNCLSADVCVCIIQVKWGFGGGCGYPAFPWVTCFTGQCSLIFPRLEAIREEMGPPAIWPFSPSAPPSLPKTPPKLSASRHRPTSTPPSLRCVFTVLTIKLWPWVFRGPNWADCWRWLWWMEGGWCQDPAVDNFFHLGPPTCCARRRWRRWKRGLLSLESWVLSFGLQSQEHCCPTV